ncbi:uncharacterized protein [Periplaneta americana]|uniref:uncharacterized protein n=1 Tax=Periplaneta americana TaxID=6978 RepID=UPI0037E98864
MVTCNFVFWTRISLLSLLIVPAAVFWIWLMKEGIRQAHNCPYDCWCSAAETAVECIHASLQNIPVGLHPRIKDLTLNHNNISVLRRNHFTDAGLMALETLTLENNGISTIEPGAFNGLPKLHNLHLKDNNLSVLELGIFGNLKVLSGLHIAGNKLKTITPGVFIDLESLYYLSLETNEIKYLRQDMFIGLTNLRNLWLSDNKISHLDPDVFKLMPVLSLISLRDNEDLYIPTDKYFLNTPHVTTYMLSDCNIKSLSAISFELSPKVSSLRLENNSITTIDLEMLHSLPELRTLSLFGNPLHCDCDMRKVWQWCEEYNIGTGFEDKVPTCDAPDEVSGLWWGVLKTADCSSNVAIFKGDYKSVVHKPVPYNSEFEDFIYFLKYVQSTVYGILFLIGAIGNITVLIIISCNKRMRTVPNSYIFNLAVGDLLNLTVNLPLHQASNLSPQWLAKEGLCKFGVFLQELSIGVSAFSVVVLSIQRYFATSGSTHLSTRNATVFAIAAVWIIASCCALPAAFSVHVEDEFLCSYYKSAEYFRMTVTFQLLVFCVIPVCVIVYMYVMTARNLVQETNCSNEENRRRKTLAKIVIGIAIVFFISFVPYHVLFTVVFWSEEFFSLALGYLMFACSCLLVLNPCLNPVSLCCTSVTYKKLFKHYLLCCCRSRSERKEEDSDLPEGPEALVQYRRGLSAEAVII